MPLEDSILPFIGSASTALTSLAQNQMNTNQANYLNAAQARYMDRTYARQRKDALADWNMQNAYNQQITDPKYVMQRLTNAGLNPNLIYDKGTGNMIQPAAQVRSSSPSSYSPVVPKLMAPDFMSPFMGVMQAQQNALLTKAQIMKTISETDTKNFDLEMKQTLKDVFIQAAELDNAKKKNDMDLSQQKNQREVLKNSQSLQEGFIRMALLESKNLTETQRQFLVAQQGMSEVLKTDILREQVDAIKQKMQATGMDIKLKELESQLKQMDLDWNKAASSPLLNNALGALLKIFLASKK